MQTRQEINRKILTILSDANENMGDQRFCQLLVNCGISVTVHELAPEQPLEVIPYSEESNKTLERVQNQMNKIFGNKKSKSK